MSRGRKETARGKAGERPIEKNAAAAALEDDGALWQAFVKSIDPLTLKDRVPNTETSLFDDMLRREAAKAERMAAPKAAHGAKGRRAAQTVPRAPGAAKPQLPVRMVVKPEEIDAKATRRLGKGRGQIDARIDLHGMRQHEAHAALRVFLFRSVAAGHRMVLIITGKGAGGHLSDDVGRTHEPLGGRLSEGAPARGVLRRNVPHWLAEADLAPIVVGFATAHLRHGGDGALYVQLRRRG